MSATLSALGFAMVPVGAALIGALIALMRPPGPLVTSGVQHFAAGVVFAAAAGEILPDILEAGGIVPTLIGGLLGIGAMLLVGRLEQRSEGTAGLLATVGVDLFIDGLVLGIAFAAGAAAGILLTVALTLEVLFLAVSTALGLGEKVASKGRAVVLTVAVVLLLPVGVLVASPVALAPEAVKTALFSFGLIALLYLVTEELLVEAHEEVEDRPWITALFFLGFLSLLLIQEMLG
ncbi:transporter [Amorphus orientalis]|uniref:ZIP family zinc transporter n=1 Tax=Amorphus orientalis TaxID=649198 RepID=A0AAE3VS92_9HYPH|nr:transporter [Amorphus orientalis]MDQ0317206.1 ZIP family zinc transporter [Amorphus orientalis]